MMECAIFERAHLDEVHSALSEFAVARGFVRKKRGRYFRCEDDGVVHGIELDIDRHAGRLGLLPALTIRHDQIGAIVEAGLAPIRQIPLRPSEKGILETRPPAFLIGEAKRVGASASYESASPRELDDAIRRMLDDLEFVAEGFFSSRRNLASLIDTFETDPWAGGAARTVTLMALYFFAGRYDELRGLIARLDEQTAPMNVVMRDYLLPRLPGT